MYLHSSRNIDIFNVTAVYMLTVATVAVYFPARIKKIDHRKAERERESQSLLLSQQSKKEVRLEKKNSK